MFLKRAGMITPSPTRSLRRSLAARKLSARSPGQMIAPAARPSSRKSSRSCSVLPVYGSFNGCKRRRFLPFLQGGRRWLSGGADARCVGRRVRRALLRPDDPDSAVYAIKRNDEPQRTAKARRQEIDLYCAKICGQDLSKEEVNAMECRIGCGACCIAPSISSPIPGMPDGKPAGVRCVQLTRRQPLQALWSARAPGSLRQPAPQRRNVRRNLPSKPTPT